MKLTEVLLLFLHMFERVIGVQFKNELFQWEKLIDVGVIIFLAVILTPAYFQIVDTLLNSVDVEGWYYESINGHKLSFVWMIIHLCLLALFTKIKHILVRFKKIFAGLTVSVVITVVLIQIIEILPNLSDERPFVFFVFSIYPILFPFLIKWQISSEIKKV